MMQSQWKIPPLWRNGDVWIIGGGSSLLEQFHIPPGIVAEMEATKKIELLSPYLSSLHEKHVIGVNVAYKLGTWIDLTVFGDTGFYLRHQRTLEGFPGIVISLGANVRPLRKNVKYLSRDTAHPLGLALGSPKAVSWNYNSGACAINVAAHAGAKRILLIGFDMGPDKNGRTHWHPLYDKVTQEGTFNRHLRGFDKIAKDAEMAGIEILNLSPDSRIHSFKKMSVREAMDGTK